MIKAVVFDLDNTLVDFVLMKQKACSAAVDSMIKSGLKIDKKKAVNALFKIYSKYGMEDHHVFQKFLKKELGYVDYIVMARAVIAYRVNRERYTTIYPNVISVLKKLKQKKMKLAIVSDAPKVKACIRLAKMKIDKYFSAVVGYEDTKRKKPSLLPFRKVIKLLKVKPSECLMVGDRPSIDLKGAKKTGMKTCWAKYGGTKGKFKADFELRDISDILKIV